VSGEDQAMSTLHADWPSTPDFHPEFGVLCPSPRRRRGMRLVMASVMAGMAVAATIELAVAHWRDRDVALAPAVTPIDEALLVERAAVPAALDSPRASARPSTSAAAADGLIARRPQGLCKEAGGKDLAAAFLNPTCGSGKAHARHGARTNYRVATVIVGRTDSLPAPAEPSHAATGTAGKATASTPQPVERPALPKKQKVAPREAF